MLFFRQKQPAERYGHVMSGGGYTPVLLDSKQIMVHAYDYCPYSLRFDALLLWVRRLKVSELKDQLKLYYQKTSGLKVSVIVSTYPPATRNRSV